MLHFHLVYTIHSTGEVIKQFRKAWERNEEGSLDKIINDISNHGEILQSEITNNTVDPETESVE